MEKHKVIKGLKVGIPEPKGTSKLTDNQILSLINDKYKVGSKGKEYNLITSYTNAIKDVIFDNDIEEPFVIKFSHVSKEWLKAVVKFITGKDLIEKDNTLIYGNI